MVTLSAILQTTRCLYIHCTQADDMRKFHLVCCYDNPLFLHTPRIPVDFGVELVVPSLSALLANAPREKGRN